MGRGFLCSWLSCLLVLVFSVGVGCKNRSCSKIKPYTDFAAIGLGEALECSGLAAMKADFLKAAESKGLCKADVMTGAIAAIVCPIVVPLAVGAVVSQTKPEWGCTGTSTEVRLTAICMALPF